jgi:uncharacterized protein YndB with AHSA1/START domain
MTTTNAAVSTTQVYQILIRATPQQIWDAIVTPEFTEQYFYGARVETTGATGDAFRHYGPDGSLWGDDMILEPDSPHRLVVTWRSLWDEEQAAEPQSRVTWQIEGRDGGTTLLTVTHDELEGSPKTAASVSGEGWMTVLSGLKTLLETGSPMTSAG